MRKLLVLAAVATCLLWNPGSKAADPASANGGAGDRPVAGGADAPTQIPANGKPILLEVGKGTLLRLDRPASTVFVANPDIADVQVKSPSLIYVDAKSPGETVLYAVDAEDHVLLNSPVRVEHDLSRLREDFHSLLPGENIDVKSVDNSLVLSGNVSTPGRAEKARALAAAIARQTKDSKIINELGVTLPNEVNLRVRVAEVDRTLLKALGINWTKTSGRFQFNTENPTTGANIIQQNLLSATFGPASQTFTTTLDALAQENLITMLAEPNLTAVSGQTASFLAGGEFPVPVAGAAGGSGSGNVPTISIEFKTFGVQLNFTPTVIDANHVSLRVRPEVSELSTTGQVSVPLTATASVTIPALTVRRAETTVELGSGQSFVLGGLMQHNAQSSISKLPWLADLPVIGQLFRSEQFQNNESELVIVVTPYLVKPSATAMAVPTDGYISPHDLQQVINASTYRQTLPGPGKGPAGRDGQGLIGPVGFRVD